MGQSLSEERESVIRGEIALALARIGPDAVPSLLQAAKGADKGVAKLALRTLGEMKPFPQAALPVLIGSLPDKSLRDEAALVILGLGSEAKAAVLFFVEELNQGQVGYLTFDVLGKMGSEAKVAILPLVKLLKARDRFNRQAEVDRLRYNVAVTLASIGPEAIPALTQVLKEGEGGDWAAFALGRIGPEAKPAVPVLIESLKHERGTVRERSAEALGRIGRGAKEAVPHLILLLGDLLPSTSQKASEALGKIGPDAIPQLVRALKDHRDGVRVHAASALGDIGPGAVTAIPALIEAVEANPRNTSLRPVIESALKRIGPEGKAALAVIESKEAEQYRSQTSGPLPEGALMRLVSPRSEHGNAVYSVAFSPTDSLLVSGGEDRTIHLWDVGKGKESHRIQIDSDQFSVHSVAFSPDGTILATAHNHVIYLWETSTGKQLRELTGHQTPVGSLTFSPDGKTLASRDRMGSPPSPTIDGGTVRLWDVHTGRQLEKLRSRVYLCTCLAFSEDGAALAIADSHGGLRVLSTADRAKKGDFGQEVRVSAVTFSDGGKTLITGGVDGMIRFWDVRTCKEMRRIQGHAARITCLVLSADRKVMVSSGGDKTVRVWEVATPKELATLKGHKGEVNSVSISPDGRTVASGSADFTILVWDLTRIKR